ncbi:hypothetical protein Tco_1157111 [Tanacetum coccineum]
MVEDLDNYHLKELRCSTQCHTQKTLWIIARGDERLILWWGIEYLEICLEHKFSTPSVWVAQFVPSTVFLLQEVQENEVFQDLQLIQKLRDDQKCMKKVEPSSRSKATEDIISIGSFVKVLGLNQYVLVRGEAIKASR